MKKGLLIFVTGIVTGVIGTMLAAFALDDEDFH